MAKVLIAQSTSSWLALPDYGAERALLKTSGGKLICFYHQGSTDSIVYNTSDDDGATWNGEVTAILRTDIGTQDIDGFSVCKDSNDDILLVCNGDSNRRLYFRKLTYGSGTWSLGSVVLISSTYSYTCPVICRRSNGDIWVTGRVSSTKRIPAFYSTNEGANWTDKSFTPASPDLTNYATDVDIIAKGTYIWIFTYCRWASSVSRIRVYEYDSSFDTGTDINTSTGVSGNIGSICALKITDTNIWVAGRTSVGIKIYNYNGSIWDSGTALTTNGSIDQFPTLSNVNSLPWMAWIDNYDYVKYRNYDGVSWQVSVQIDYTGNQLEPVIALPSDSSKFYVTWGDYSSPKNLWIDKYSNIITIIKTILSDIKFKGTIPQTILSDLKFLNCPYTLNLIPTMTSNTTPNGVASVINFIPPHDAYFAFDHAIGLYNKWLCNGITGWLQYQFILPKIIEQYTIQEPGEVAELNRMPKDWTFKGSNDGSSWDILDIRINEPTWSTSEKRTYQFANNVSYLYYRIDITTNEGNANYVVIGELEMMEYLYQPLNNSFESWSSVGNPGVTSGVCDNWTDCPINGGTSTRQTNAPTGGGTYSVNIRSNAAGNVSSIGGIVSDEFYLINNTLTFWHVQPESLNVIITFYLLDSSDNILMTQVITPSMSWIQQSIDVSAYINQNVKVKFTQHTNQESYGFATFIDLVTLEGKVIIQQSILSDINFISNQQTILSDVNFKGIISKNILSDIEFITALPTKKTILSDVHFISVIEVLSNINNKFNLVKQSLTNVLNKINIVILSVKDITNTFNMVKGQLLNVLNDFRTHKLGINNVNNDVRFIKDFQFPGQTIPGAIGFQSLGKTYIHLYINGTEQTDVDVDSITIRKMLDSTHNASFDLARKYDSLAPLTESIVEIYYQNSISLIPNWKLYRGHIVSVTPSENPEYITVNCNDKYWKQNQSNVYFHVGHRPTDDAELYYERILDALTSEFSWTPGIGNFVPDTMDLFTDNESDAITKLIQECGNYGWYYDENWNKQLWTSGQGSIIQIERQPLGQNLNLYHLLNHQFTKSAESIINKFRVQLGDKVIRNYNSTGAAKQFSSYLYSTYITMLTPAWDKQYEILAKDSPTGYGWDYHLPEDDGKYKDVFKKFHLPGLNKSTASWSDTYPTCFKVFDVLGSFWLYGHLNKTITEGFTIDFENVLVTFNEPLYFFTTDNHGEITSIRSALIEINMWKKTSYSSTQNPNDNPETDITNPLMFFTSKMGDYPIEILKELNLSNFSIQIGGTFTDINGVTQYIPSWDDIIFATDYANWQLSKICDEKITGTIELTLDAVCFYNIDLSKRIYIPGITDEPMNIIEMSYNMNSFIVTISLENSRGYNRTISKPTRGE